MSDINNLKIHRDTPYYLYGIFIMIKINNAKKFCKDDISLIENYDKAINDKTQTWQCHHKAEILPCGRFSSIDLIKFDLYFNRPASELIFLTEFNHKSLHHTGKKVNVSEETRKKLSEANKGRIPWNKGKHHTQDVKIKISEYSKKCRWFNNGINERFCSDCPEGFVKGRLKRKSI